MILNSKKRISFSLMVTGIGIFSEVSAGPLARVPNSIETPVVEVVNEVEAQPDQWLNPQISEKKTTLLKREKKITRIETQAAPIAPTNQYRTQLARIPGLLVSEVNNESFASMSFRGLGDPHESQNLLFLEDGAPIAADLYGYPAHYYQPPAEWIEASEFIRGGASLLHGPLPGGTLSYELRQARLNSGLKQRYTLKTGSFRTHSGSAEVSTQVGEKDAVLIQLHRRMSDGFRSANSQYDMTQARLQWLHTFSNQERIRVTGSLSQALHGEPGGLALASGSNVRSYFDDRTASTLLHDRLKLDRYFGSVLYENEISDRLLFQSRLYGGFFSRDSFRQNVGSAPTFGGVANATTNVIQSQDFKTLALDSRIKLEYDGLSEKDVLSAGVLLYGVDSPFTQEAGQSANASSGTPQKDILRGTRTVSAFAENRFKFGSFSISPGFRLENIKQSISENLNSGSTVANRNTTEWDHVLLLGLGMLVQMDPIDLYANFSQGYKPRGFQDTVPLQTGDTISSDLNPARTWMLEMGVRDQLSDQFKWDVSGFLIRYSDQFGRVGNQLQNTGGALHQGVETTFDLTLLRSSVELHYQVNGTYLFAQFREGPLMGKTPQYAPRWQVKQGVYTYIGSKLKAHLNQIWTSDHFADDGNTFSRKIPTYRVWDFSVESEIFKKGLKAYMGIFNLFDEAYFSRVRSNGVEPALPRQISFGLSLDL